MAVNWGQKKSTAVWGKPAVFVPSVRTVALEEARLNQLIRLCHPDKHNGSATATDVFQWLQSIKKGDEQ